MSPFDLLEVEHEWTPRGQVALRRLEDSGERWVPIPPGRWRHRAGPLLPESRPPSDSATAESRTTDEPDERLEHLRDIARRVDTAESHLSAAWLHLRIAELADDDPSAAEAAAVKAVERSGNGLAEGWVWRQIGLERLRRGQLEEAREALQEALRIWTRKPSERLSTGEIHYLLGETAGRAGDPGAEEKAHRQGLEIRRRLAPGTLPVARSWMRVAKARATQDDTPGAFAAARQALAIAEAVAPAGLDHENCLMLLGIFHWFEEEWDLAEGYLREAQQMIEQIDPGHEDGAIVLANLGIVAAYRGDLAGADAYHHRALEKYQQLGSEPLKVSRTLNNLANNAEARHDYVAAERYHTRSLEIRESLAADSLDVATALLNLGNLAVAKQDNATAESRYRRALAIQQRLVPGTRDVAMTLSGLGRIRQMQGALAEAQSLQRQALALVESVAPASILASRVGYRLAQVLVDAGGVAEAERLLRRADRTLVRLAPDTLQLAVTLHALALLQRDGGRQQEALVTLARAVEVMDAQLRRVGGSEDVRSSFRAVHLDLYRDYLELLLAVGSEEEAFEVLERTKAKSLLVLLRERHIDLMVSAPPELRERLLAVSEAYDEAQGDLAEGAGVPAGERRATERRLVDLRQQQAELWQEIRRRSPSLERVDPAQTLDAATALTRLGEGTVALSYSLGTERSHLFILGPGRRFRYTPVPAGEENIRALVDRFRLLLERPPPSSARSGHRKLATELFDLLVRPAAEEIEASSRILVSPDGPLHLLPFAALADDRGRYLVEWRPLFQAASLTVFAELRRRPRGPTVAGDLTAFADPAHNGSGRLGGEALILGRRLTPLPFSREELNGVLALYGGQARGWLGEEATEARAKSLSGALGSLHYATHAFVDHASPLDSGLVLAPSTGADRRWHNGVLQAWEVFQDIRLDADLVTLSACETGGGPVVAGEGLLSLTRAFQAGGARSVVASLWEISDRSTARLMIHFYRNLRAGRAKDEALREAQLALLRTGPQGAQPDTSHPYYWAAFQLYGDPDSG